MKLSKCKIGEVVIREDQNIGHIIGLTYNIRVRYSGSLTYKELLERVIPIVRWVDGYECPIHNNSIEIYKG